MISSLFCQLLTIEAILNEKKRRPRYCYRHQVKVNMRLISLNNIFIRPADRPNGLPSPPSLHINHTVTHLTHLMGRVTLQQTLVILNISQHFCVHVCSGLGTAGSLSQTSLITHCSLSNPAPWQCRRGQFLVSEEHLSAGPGASPLTWWESGLSTLHNSLITRHTRPWTRSSLPVSSQKFREDLSTSKENLL